MVYSNRHVSRYHVTAGVASHSWILPFTDRMAPSMDGDVIHGWWSPLVADPSDETDGMIHRGSIPSIEIHSVHGWRISISGMQHRRHIATGYVSRYHIKHDTMAGVISLRTASLICVWWEQERLVEVKGERMEVP